MISGAVAAGLNYWLTIATRREYVPEGSGTASLLSKVTAFSQQRKHSELGKIFGVIKRVSVRDLILLNTRQ